MGVTYTEQEGLRVVGAIRQSKTKKQAGKKGGELLVKGVSLEEQKHKITQWATAYGHTVVKLTEDPSTSGKTSPFKRLKGIGPYLTDPELIASWDVLAATKLDRIARNAEEFLGLLRWAKEHGKAVKILNLPDLDDSSPYGKMVLTILAAVAEAERMMACERRADTVAELESQGRWQGGAVPYGWRAVQRDGKSGWYLEPDEGGTADVLRQMARLSTDGKSNGQIQRWLTGHAHPPWSLAYLNAAGKLWSVERTRLVLHSPYTAKLLDQADAGDLAAALRERAPADRGERVGGHQLLRVAFCKSDGGPLYYQKKRRTRKISYYRCLQCGQNVRADWLEATVEKVLLANAGSWKLAERRLVRGDGPQEAIKALRTEVKTLEAIKGTEAVVAAKQAEIAKLEAEGYTPDKWVTSPTGQTVAQRWAALGHEERGSFLRLLGIVVKADKSSATMMQEGGPWKEGWLPVLGLLPPQGALTGKSGRVMWTVAA
jgi:DNA invertase Pin-like site-specific DNA recombinase